MTQHPTQTSGLRAWAAEARATLALGWPIALTNLAEMAITTTDVLMMGWLGPDELAAGTLGANLFYAFFVIGMGLALGTAPVMAQALGRRRHAVRELRSTVGQGFLLSLLYVLPVWALMWQARPILEFLGQDPALTAATEGYVRALQWGVLPALMFVVLRAFVSSLERPGPALVVTALAIALNAFVNWVLMFGKLGMPEMGIVGAGVSSTIANCFMALGLLAYCAFDRRFRRYRLAGAAFRPDLARLKELLRVGAPISVGLGFEITVFNVAALLMGLLGATALAAHAIAMQVAAITFMVPMGMGQAGTVRVGLAAGRGDAAGVARAGWTAIGLGVGFMVAMAAALVAFPEPIVGAFLDLADPGSAAVLELAAAFLGVAALFQVFDGAQATGSGALRGLKDTRVPMMIAGFGYWVLGVPLAAGLAFWAGLGGTGIWGGLALGLAAVASLMVGRWSRREALGLVPRRPGDQASLPSTSSQPAILQDPSGCASM
jgi:MATE family multidrug resistance protein